MLRLRASHRLLFSLSPFYQGLLACQWLRGGQIGTFPKSIGGETFSLYQEAQYTLLAR